MTDELLEICLRRNVEGCFFHLPCRAPSQSRNRLYRRRNFRTRCRKPAGDWCPSLRTRSPYNLPGNHFESALGVPQLVCLDSRCIWPVQGGEKKKKDVLQLSNSKRKNLIRDSRDDSIVWSIPSKSIRRKGSKSTARINFRERNERRVKNERSNVRIFDPNQLNNFSRNVTFVSKFLGVISVWVKKKKIFRRSFEQYNLETIFINRTIRRNDHRTN